MLVWCPRACSPLCLLLFRRQCVCPLRWPAPRLMSLQRTPRRSHSPYPHPCRHWHGRGSEPPSWTHPQRYCHLWTCLWADAEGVSLTTRKKERGNEKQSAAVESNWGHLLMLLIFQDYLSIFIFCYFILYTTFQGWNIVPLLRFLLSGHAKKF